jgi:hypothetical protein
MAAQQEGEKERGSKRLWQFIPLEDYNGPEGPTVQAVREGASGKWRSFKRVPILGGIISNIKKRLRSSDQEASNARRDFMDAEIPHRVSGEVLDQAVHTPNWGDPAFALNAALDNWLHSDSNRCPAKVLVGAPYSGISRILIEWARINKWRVPDPPVFDEILNGGKEWLSYFARSKEGPLVLPNLERCYLRHYDGLTLIRRLLDLVLSHSRPCLIGCNSWAWSYLNKALRLQSIFNEPLTLDAFDHESLQVWFEALAHSANRPFFVFRQLDNGMPVLPRSQVNETTLDEDQDGDTEADDSDGKEEEVTPFLRHVAAHSRGIPGVALAIWRHCLRSVPEKELGKGLAQKIDAKERTLWVRPWSQIDLPVMSVVADNRQMFVLHALLIHNGLPAAMLSRLLPLNPMAVAETLHRLRRAGLLEERRGVWHVCPLGYPVVREQLESEGYLVDRI